MCHFQNGTALNCTSKYKLAYFPPVFRSNQFAAQYLNFQLQRGFAQLADRTANTADGVQFRLPSEIDDFYYVSNLISFNKPTPPSSVNHTVAARSVNVN